MGGQMWTERLALPRLPLCQVFVSLGARRCAFISAHAWLRLANHQVVRCDKALQALLKALCFAELSAAIIICVIIVSIQLSHMQLMHLIWPYPASLHSARLWWRWILHHELSGREITLLRVIPTMTFQNSLLTPLLSEAFVTGLLPN
jgi:hypothetical protein